ncbi:MAG: ferredoxin [Firmicutes bacterium]|nr:ferredoxin [Bacillota bacterium]
MIANYGYKDGSGDYFISMDTDKCSMCKGKPCVAACPKEILEIFINDYDNEVAGIKEKYRKKIKYICAECKPISGKRTLFCLEACPLGAIVHSW